MSCLTSAIEPLRAANEISGRAVFSWSVVGETGTRVRSSADVGFDPDVKLGDLAEIDQLYFLSGPAGAFDVPGRANAAVRKLARHGAVIGAFSGGIFPLARSALLSGYCASVHWCYEAAFRAEFDDVIATARVITIDRGRRTAAGASAVFDLMLGVIETHLGPDIMTEVACWFQHPLVRGEHVDQKTPLPQRASAEGDLPDPVAQAIRIFADHVEEPVRIFEVASAVALSPRQLDRAFQRATGLSPIRYYRLLRMKKARQLALYSNDSMTDIALSVGYASSTPMLRYYIQAFGVTPQEDRRAINRRRAHENASIPSG